VVGAGPNPISTAYAKIVVYDYLLPGAVVAVFYRAGRDTGMTVDAFFLINPDDRRQFICLHKLPPYKTSQFYMSLFRKPRFWDSLEPLGQRILHFLKALALRNCIFRACFPKTP
jgi:hypothetical protein